MILSRHLYYKHEHARGMMQWYGVGVRLITMRAKKGSAALAHDDHASHKSSGYTHSCLSATCSMELAHSCYTCGQELAQCSTTFWTDLKTNLAMHLRDIKKWKKALTNADTPVPPNARGREKHVCTLHGILTPLEFEWLAFLEGGREGERDTLIKEQIATRLLAITPFKVD